MMRRLILSFIVLLLFTGAAFAFWGYRSLKTPVAHGSAGGYVVIPRGSSPNRIINELANRNIINNKLPLLIYLKLSGDGARLKAGEYRFKSPISPLDVIAKLKEGEQRLTRFTVIEGWTRWDIAEAMSKISELQLKDKDAALALMNNVSLIRDVDPTAENLEGYLYPDTYSFPPTTTAKEMIALMVARFKAEWTPTRAAQARARDMTARQIMTVASLIETEAKLAAERPLVASVIYNRLRLNMALGIDSSIIYASKLAGKWRGDGKVYQSDLDRPSPYNTRRVTGLPPAPIAASSRSAIDAALNPASTDFLYYVRDPARDDGAHNFYARDADFARGVQALREWERQRDASR
ncbi:MAG: endolytic transglycosylase MltG [Pyrinomonadaceae bacterium MAG19_C2-C3]|nr:endolytic transglycosylase MltG [Pyrinomonadaceae bacterium MAG19_C2-C3]